MGSIAVPQAFQSVSGLGDAKSVYKQGAVSRLINIVACLLGVLIALAIGYYGLVLYPRQFPDVAATNTPYIVGFAALVLLGALYMAWRVASRWRNVAVLYSDGFAHFDGKSLLTFQWDEISEVTVKIVRMMYAGFIPAGTQRAFTIVGRSGVLKLDGTLTKVDDLLNTVREKAFAHIRERCQAALETGQPVQFGPLTMSKKDGIRKGRRHCAWADVSEIDVNNGTVEVKSRKSGLFSGISAPAASIPNLDVFLDLANELAKQAP